MIVTSIVLPAMLAARTVDMMRGLFLCFAFASILNVFFVLHGSSEIVLYGAKLVDIGDQGYFEGKNYLGECAAVAFLLSLHEILQRGWRRALGIIVVVSAILLILLSNSKTAFGLALICSIPGCTYVDCQKDNALFSGDNSIAHTIVLHRIVQRIQLQRLPHIVHTVRRFDFDGSHHYMGFRKFRDCT